ncbi:MAG: EAL domain-containing protein [Peptostreptococcaceae bacterium]
MFNINFLYTDLKKFDEQLKLNNINKKDKNVVQIFTSKLTKEEGFDLAQKIKSLMPNSYVVGISTCAVIYDIKQYDNETLIVIEKFSKSNVSVDIFEFENKEIKDLLDEVCEFIGESKFSKIFFGGYYDYTHQFANLFNRLKPGVQLVGGMAGETVGKVTPYVFTSEKIVEKGILFVNIENEDLSVFNGINMSNQEISSTYKVTKVDGKDIIEIDNKPAVEWVEKNLGVIKKKNFDSWDDIANNDPLIHFQVMFKDGSSRYIRYDDERDVMTQYFSRIEEGTSFKLSYNSPLKCVEESKEICIEITEEPVESIFCYTCLFRKLYLANCAEWELLPYKDYKISGVFMLGEMAYLNGKNVLLNGSCVINTISENENYILTDTTVLDNLHEIEAENNNLVEFILRKQKEAKTLENTLLLNSVIEQQKSQKIEMYLDPHMNMKNLLKYEQDKNHFKFDKLALIRIESAESIIGYVGQDQYFKQINAVKDDIHENVLSISEYKNSIHTYSSSFDTFLVSSNEDLSLDNFNKLIEKLYDYVKTIEMEDFTIPIVSKFAVVIEQEYLLEKAYRVFQLTKESQIDYVVYNESIENSFLNKKEYEILEVLRYALKNDGVVPFYQGIHNNETDEIDKYEALIRIKDKEGRIYTPYQFMDISKKYRIYLEMSKKMIEKVFEDFENKESIVSINLSAHDINSDQFREFIIDRLSSIKNPHNLVFEILEDECFKDIKILKEFIKDIRRYGAKVSIDDFGSGYSNLLEIARIRPDFLKIDGEIIKEVDLNYENELILKTISSLAKDLSMKIVAEFVENESIQNKIEKFEIEYSQGYHFAKPMPINELNIK